MCGAQGNHDFVPSGSDVSPQTSGWLAAVADVWAHHLPEPARVSFSWGGYYTTVPVPGLRVAVLNTQVRARLPSPGPTVTQAPLSEPPCFPAAALIQVCHVGNINSFVDGGAAARVQLAWLKVRAPEPVAGLPGVLRCLDGDHGG
jgi:hypothetical protein